MRFSIQLVQAGKKQPITMQQAETFDEAHKQATQVHRSFCSMTKGSIRPTMKTFAQVLDKQTGKVFPIHLSKWLKPTTAKVIASTGEDYFEDAPEVFADMADELFSQEGC